MILPDTVVVDSLESINPPDAPAENDTVMFRGLRDDIPQLPLSL